MTASSTDADQHDDGGDVLAELVAEHVQMDRDVFEIDHARWAIHGYIAYDGEVIAATFASEKKLGRIIAARGNRTRPTRVSAAKTHGSAGIR